MHLFRVMSKIWNLPIENGLKLNLKNISCENRRIRSLKGEIIKNQCEKVIGRCSIVLLVLKKYHATFSGFFVNFRHSKSGTKMVVNHFKTCIPSSISSASNYNTSENSIYMLVDT